MEAFSFYNTKVRSNGIFKKERNPMVIHEKIKSRFSRNWSLRNRGQAFCIFKRVFFSLLVITMAFGKKDKIFKLALEFLLLAAFHCCLALYTHTSAFIFVWFINWWAVLFIEAEAELISKLFYSNQ